MIESNLLLFKKTLIHFIVDSIQKSENIFTNVLLCKEKADLTRSLLLALSRHRFLFCLPKTIETHAAAGEYDIVVNDYARAQSRFGKTEIPVSKLFTTFASFHQIKFN